MKNLSKNSVIYIIISIIAVYTIIKFGLPLLLPFLLGGLLSVAAEPAVRFGCEKLRFKRPLSAFLGMSLTLSIALCAALAIGALAVKEVKVLARLVPDLQKTAQTGILSLQENLLLLCKKAPAGIRPLLERSVTNTLADGEGILTLSAQKIPALLTGLAGKVPGSAIGVGTGILASFLISARLPKLKVAIHSHIPQTALDSFRYARKTAGKWFLAQGKLMLVTYGIVTIGLWFSKIPHAPAWAVLTAAVDAVPLLGTGIILVPWALVKLMQSQYYSAIGLLCTYAAAMVTRTVLEPRLVGKQLGLDPLVTLAAIYCGFRLWGFWGMVLAPVSAALVKNLLQKPTGRI